jgi:hypothetical protein
MFPYFQSASQAIRYWFRPPQRRPIRNARVHTPLHLESLEDRTLFNATVTPTVTNGVLQIALTDAAADTTTVSIHRKSSDKTNADFNNLEIVLNGTAQSTTYALTTLTSIQLQAGAGTDTLKVDQGNGNLNLPVTFLAGTGSDTYLDTDADLSGVKSSGNFVLGDQLNTQLNNLQTLLNNNIYNQPLPVVVTTCTNNLKDVGQADILGSFSTTLQNALDNTSTSNANGLASSAGPADIQKAIFAALGPNTGGANMLQTLPGDANKTADLNDVVVVANNGAFSYEMNLANQNQTFDTGTLLDFNPGMAGLPLTLSAQSQQVVQTKFGFSYDFRFNIPASTAASIDNSTTSSNPLLIDLNAGLASGYEDKGATLGLLNADITDSTTHPTTLTAQYHMTFGGSGATSTASAMVSGTANIGLHMVLSMPTNQLGPDALTGGPNNSGDSLNLIFDTDMSATWNFGTSAAPIALGPLTSFGSQPTVAFSVSMDANTFFQDFVKPIVTDDILPEFKPAQSIVDALDYKVPVLGIGLDDVLNNPALAPVGNFRGFFESVHKFQLLAQDLASFPTVVGTVDLGSFSISQDARVKTYGPNQNDFVTIMGGDVTPPAMDPLTQLRNLVDDPSHRIADLSTLDPANQTLDVIGEALKTGSPVNFFDMIQETITFGLFTGFQTLTYNLLDFPMLDSPVNIFNMLMDHQESLLTWNSVPIALRITQPFTIPSTEVPLPGGSILLVPQIKWFGHFAGGFDTHGLEIDDPNQGFYLTDADPNESDRPDMGTIVDQISVKPNFFQSTFMRLTVSFSVDVGFSTSAIGIEFGDILDSLGTQFTIGIGIQFGGDVLWKPDDPDTSTLSHGLETSFSDRTFEQQVMRASELVSELQNCGNVFQTSGDVTFAFNFEASLKIFHIPIFATVINLATFKIADFNTPPCTDMGVPPLAHFGNPANNVAGPYAAAHPSKEVATTLYLNTATAQPTNNSDTSQDDTFIIKALANNNDGTDNLLVISQGRSEEFDNVHDIYADGGGGNDSFLIKPGVRVPAVIRDGDGGSTRSILVFDQAGNPQLQPVGPGDHLEYDGSGNASLYAGDGDNTLIGGTGTNILVSGNGNSILKASGPGSLSAGNGDNTIRGGSGTQTITVGNGNNNITFGSGDSTITLGTGANTITGRIREGHVTISDPSSTDNDHTGAGLVDELILNGTTNPDNVHFSTGTLNGSPAVQIDDGTASSTWSVTAQNINTITFHGGGNSGAIGRDGDHITVGDLSSTGVATININPNHGGILNQQKDAFTVLGTTYDDKISINGDSTGVAVTGLAYTVNVDGLEPAYDSLTVNGNGGNDTATVAFAGDFNGRLNLLAFEHGSVTVNGNWNGTLTDTQPGHLESVNIVNGSMTPTGVLQVGSLDAMTIGPAHLSVGQDLAGQLVVFGALGSLRVAGGAPGSITAGHIGTVSVYGGFGPVVMQITENGIQRRVEEATPGNHYPLPDPTVTAATSPYATVNAMGPPSYINIQYIYESGTLANPQWTARISNNVSTAADQFDLSLVTYNDKAKFNLARLDAAGISGVRNVAIEGDVLKAVSPAAVTFLADSTAAGVRLPLDKLADVAVRDFLPAGFVQAKSIQGLAFGSYTSPNGSLATGSAANGAAAAGLLVPGTAIVQANDTFRVPFADLATQQVGLFLDTVAGASSFSNANVILVVEGVPGTGNTIMPSNVARGAVTALVAVSGTPAGSVIQTISLRGDGASIRTSQYIAHAIISTGRLGDLQLQSTLGITDVTAPSIFGSILAQGPLAGTIQTTGMSTNPITSMVTPVSADLGNVFVASSSHGPFLTVTTIQASGGTGRIISRGKLLSQVQVSGGFSGLVAAQGDIGTIVGSTRLGGILIGGTFSGQIVTLGKMYGDLVVSVGGSLGGRIAAKLGFLGNVMINGTFDATSAIVSGGEIGDVGLGTHLTVNGTNNGIIAAEGPANLGKAISTGPGGFYQATIPSGTPNHGAIDAVFSQALAFDLPGMDLGGLALILADLKTLKFQ